MVAVVLGLSGFATLVYEIAWVRVLSLLVGPTTYAFAATLVTLIAGIGCGSLIGSRLAGRSRRPALWLSITMAATAMVTSWSTAVVGRNVPRLLAEPLSQLAPALAGLLSGHAVLVAALIVPTALGLGVGFPLALELLGSEAGVARRVGMVYAVNTLAALAGSLVAGFIAIPLLSLQPTLQLVSAMLLLGASVVIAGVKLPPRLRVVGVAVVALAVLPIVWNPQWDRDVLASGVYKYARRSTPGLDPMATLRAGKLLYYRDGAASTVSVKRLTGVISMSIDGKIDASSSGDMLTQKVLAHLPLLLHPDPRQVLVIGLGSGVTAASALVHPIARLDVVEISPEVVQASQYFKAQNRGALRDPRTHLILGDGRSHLLLSRRQYDVIVSEPSNPWMAGVAALFTREFFAAARERLAPGGVICQWAHTYDISEHDLRSIVATFRSVFPQGTMWLLGEGDVLLVASNSPLDVRLDGLTASWRRSGVAADLGEASVLEPFALLSQYVAGPRELERYADAVAPQTDDRMALEFSGPRALNSGADRHNASMLRALLQPGSAPMAVRRAMEAASGPQWRDRATMLLKIDDYEGAYRDYARALQSDSTDALALDGFVQAAGATGQQAEALARLKDMIGGKPGISTIRIAASRLLASSGAFQDAIAVLTPRGAIELDEGALLEQLASIYADLGESQKLDQTVARLRQFRPDTARTFYFAAAAEFLRQRFAQAATLAEKSVALDPQSSSAHNLVGVSRASEGRPEQARHAFLKALVLAPRDVTTYVNLGLLELSAGNRAAAA
ncbi:MAG: fused MFS/spermidine synthase, partial [Acidobacteria bacterium]|nr:fused MFS/spermidine synthase [Acidobacteriota bacterium]